MYKLIVVPAKKLIAGAQRVAEGDLTTEIELTSSDELVSAVQEFTVEEKI